MLHLTGILAALAIAGLLNGCSSSPPTPTPTSLPLSPLSADAVGKIHFALTQVGVTASELEAACGYYANHGWSFDDAWKAANKAAWEVSPPDPLLTRLVDVISAVHFMASAVHFMAEDFAIPEDWAVSVVKSLDRSVENWTEADYAHYEGVTDARKRQLIEPLCTQ